MRWLRLLAVLTAITGIVLLASSGTGTRLGVWHYRTGLGLIRYAAYVGIAATVLSLIALAVAKPRGSARTALVCSLLVGIGTFAVPYSLSRKARAVPPIHDITTDPVDPPLFVAVLPLRATATNSAEYAGDSIAALQRAAYPDVRPLDSTEPAPALYSRALDAAKAMGWEIVAADSAAGRIEATATTTWFGFKDDVVVRVRAHGRAIGLSGGTQRCRCERGTHTRLPRSRLRLMPR
jgi:Protein of unknown function (DUF1499)